MVSVFWSRNLRRIGSLGLVWEAAVKRLISPARFPGHKLQPAPGNALFKLCNSHQATRLSTRVKKKKKKGRKENWMPWKLFLWSRWKLKETTHYSTKVSGPNPGNEQKELKNQSKTSEQNDFFASPTFPLILIKTDTMHLKIYLQIELNQNQVSKLISCKFLSLYTMRILSIMLIFFILSLCHFM